MIPKLKPQKQHKCTRRKPGQPKVGTGCHCLEMRPAVRERIESKAIAKTELANHAEDMWHEDTEIECVHGSTADCAVVCLCGHPCDQHLLGYSCRWGNCECTDYVDWRWPD